MQFTHYKSICLTLVCMEIILMYKLADGLVSFFFNININFQIENVCTCEKKFVVFQGVDSGIGAGVDSFYEYLVKGAIMLNRPELMQIFKEAKFAIDKYLSKNDWHIWASMTKGLVTIPVFQSLDAYWPGVLSMVGDITNAMKSIYNYHSVWKQYGFLPEFYNSKFACLFYCLFAFHFVKFQFFIFCFHSTK